MARYLTNPLLALIDSVLPDNSTGEITPADMRQLLRDMVESLRPTGSYMARSATLLYNFTNTAYVNVPNLFTDGETRDPAEIVIDVPNGTMTAKFAADYSFTVSVTATGASNEILDLAVGVNGVPRTFFRTDVNMTGTTSPVASSMSGYLALQVNDVVTVMMASQTAPANITLGPVGVVFQLVPTRGA